MKLPRFDVTIDRHLINSTTINLIWVTAVDQNYQILTSTNLIDWTEDGGHQR